MSARRTAPRPRSYPARARVALPLVAALAGLAGCTADDSSADASRADARADTHDGAFDGAPSDATTLETGGLVDALPGDGPALPGSVTSVRVEPATITLRSTDAERMPAQRFRAVGVRADGSTLELPGALWTLSHDRVGSVAGDGAFTANGVAAGAVTLTAEVAIAAGSTARATAEVTVRVERDVRVDESVAPELVARAAAATPGTGGPPLLYPLDGAVMPNNVLAPDVQWEPSGSAGDVFRVRLEKPNLVLRAYVSHTGAMFDHHLEVPSALWRAAVESDPEAPLSVTVDRFDASDGRLVAGGSARVRVASGSIAGTIYYWDLSAGTIQRIAQGERTSQLALPNPPRRARDGSRCVACHAVSRDGRYLSAELWDGGDFGTVFDLTGDLAADPSPTLFPPDRVRFLFSTFSPDGARLLANNGNALALLDTRTGMPVMTEGLPERAAHPDWAPAGNHIAFVSNTDGSWAVDFTRGDLSVAALTGPDRFGPARVVHRGDTLRERPEGGATDSHPSWSPDGRLLAFGHGTHSRSLHEGRPQPGALYLTDREGLELFRLDRANGGAAGVDSYWPTFSPFRTPDRGSGRTYLWLAFHSRRAYGNERAGTRGANRPQLWVTAIDANPSPGEDPSSVPYWLPGQRRGDANMAAFWAAQACRTNGAECMSSGDCCSGLCRPDAAMPERFVCSPPPAAMCRREGQTCGGAADCCEGLVCSGNVCLGSLG